MRARNIKPGFFTNEKLAECSPIARLLFVGLWCAADRDGRLEDRPKRIKAELLPYDSVNADDLLRELESNGFIVRYEVDGLKCIQIPRFGTHQNPHPKEPVSKLPEPVAGKSEPATELNDSPCNATAGNGITGTSPADSLILIPDPPIPESVSLRSTASVPKAKSAKKSANLPEGFDVFWAAYPRHEAKQNAIKAWLKIAPDLSLKMEIVAAVERLKKTEQWQRGFAPHASTFLNQQRWTDEPTPQAGTLQPPGPPNPDEDWWDRERLKGRALKDVAMKIFPPDTQAGAVG